MKFVLPRIALVVASSLVPAASQADNAQNAFLESARMATAKYQDRSIAIADGYRQIGSDFPAMGEHWIRVGLLFDGVVDPAHPEMLTYAFVSGKPQLLGVAFLLPLLAGESAPDWPVPKEKWHDHYRTLEDETSLPRHHAPGQEGDVPRMTMLHAWIWLENPAGIFAADNWAVPYLRLGMTPAREPGNAVAKALALASGGTAYFSASIHAAVPLTPAEGKKIDGAFARSRAAVEAWLREHSRTAPSPSDLERLSTVWKILWRDIDSSVGHKARQSLQLVPVR